MGRAIDMENELQKLKAKIKVLEDALYTVIGVVDSMKEKAQKVTHINLHEDVEEQVEEKPTAKKVKKRSKAAA